MLQRRPRRQIQGPRQARRHDGRGDVTKIPPIRKFSGDGKGAVSYEAWRQEVGTLLGGRLEPGLLKYQVLHSLDGQAAELARTFPPQTPLEEILEELDKHYGPIHTRSDRVARLYTLRQQLKEPVSDFALRVRVAVSDIREHYPDYYAVMEVDTQKKDVFFNGLKKDLKLPLTLLYRRRRSTFDDLRHEAREMEKRHQVPDLTAPAPKPVSQFRFGAKANPTPMGRGFPRPIQAKEALVGGLEDLELEAEPPPEETLDEAELEAGDQESPVSAEEVITLMARMVAPKKRTDFLKKTAGGPAGKPKTTPARDPQPPSADTVCYRCGETGHYTNQCPAEKPNPELVRQ